MKRQYDPYFIHKELVYNTIFRKIYIIWKSTFIHSGNCPSFIHILNALSVCLVSRHFAK